MEPARSPSSAPLVRPTSPPAHPLDTAQPACSSPASVALAPLTTDAAAAAPLNSPAFVPRLSPQAEISSLDLGTSLSASASSGEDSASETASQPQPVAHQPTARASVKAAASSTSSSELGRTHSLNTPASSGAPSSGDVPKRQPPPHLDSIEDIGRKLSPACASAADAQRTSTDDGSSTSIDGAAFPPPPRRGVDSATWRSGPQSPSVESTSASRLDRKPGTWRLRNGSHPTRPALHSQDHVADRRPQESTQDSVPPQGRPGSVADALPSPVARSSKWANYSATLTSLGSRGDGDDSSFSEQARQVGSSPLSASTSADAEHAAVGTGHAERRLRALTMSSVPLPHPSTLPRPTLPGSFAPAMQPFTRASASTTVHGNDVFAKMAGAGPPSPYPPPGSSSTFSSTDSLLSSRQPSLAPALPLLASSSFHLPVGGESVDAPWRSRMPSSPAYAVPPRDGHIFGAAAPFPSAQHTLPFSSPGEADCASARLARLDALRRTVEQQELALQQGYFDAETAQLQLEHFQEELQTLQRAGLPAPLSMPTHSAPLPPVRSSWPAGAVAPPPPYDGGDDAWWNEQIRAQQQYNSGGGPSPNNRKLGLYKTELCRSWEERGNCRYGSKCQFAHGNEELRPVQRHAKYKTEICRTFWRTGQCPYARRCCFIHMSPGDAPNEENKTDEVSRSRVPLLARVGVSNGTSNAATPERSRAASGSSPRSGDVAVSVLREAIASTPSWAEDLRRGRAHSSASVHMLGSTDSSPEMPRRGDSVESLTDAASRARGFWTPGGSAAGDARGARVLSSPPPSATIRLPDFTSMHGATQPARTGTSASLWNPATTAVGAPRSDDRDADFFGPLRSAFEQRGSHAASTTSNSTPRSTSGLPPTPDSTFGALGARTAGAAPWSLWRQQAHDGDAASPSHGSRRSSRLDETEAYGLGLGLSGVSLRNRSSSNATTGSAFSLDRDSFFTALQTRSSPPSSPTGTFFAPKRSETSKAPVRPQHAQRTSESVQNTPGSMRTSTTLSSDAGSPWTPSHARELGADIAFNDRETTPPKQALVPDDITFGSTATAPRSSAHLGNGVFFTER